MTTPLVEQSPDALIGRKIGHFLIEARLGVGAMATVYSAKDQILNRQVALKVLLPGADPVVQERFRQEARTVSGLAHPHIVRTLQVGQTDADGITYIAMELVEGVSLADLLETHRQLSPADSCRLLEPIARALTYAHSQQVIHRDVKPSNVLLRRVGPGTPNSVQIAVLDYPVVPLLSDFGIALAADSPELTAAGRTIGTPTYMAPEQCSGSRTIDGRADIYALGTVLYRCLAGRPPFVGSTTQVLHAHVYEALTMPEPVMRTLPPMVFTVLQRTLAKDPDERYLDAAKLAQDLARTAVSVTKGWPQEELTATMESLPAAILADAAETLRVLVPAPAPKLSLGRSAPVSPTRFSPSEYKISREKAAPTQTRNFWQRAIGVGIGLLIGLLLVTLGIMLIVTGVPFDLAGIGARATPTAGTVELPTATPLAGEATTTLAAATQPEATTPTDLTTPTTANTEAALPPVTEPLTATATSAGATAAANLPVTRTQVISNEVKGFWEDAFALYETREWDPARQNLIVVLRKDPTFETARLNRGDRTLGAILQESLLQRPEAWLWQQGRNLFTAEQIEQIYFEISLGLATAANAQGELEMAAENFAEALSMRPNDSQVAGLLSATQTLLAAADETAKTEARTLLGTAHRNYANELAGADSFCAASEQLQAAAALLVNEDLSERLQVYQKECETRLVATGGRNLLKNLTGAIIYSTQVNDRYQIYRQPLILEAPAKLLVNEGTQPQVAPNGRWLAFYSRQNGREGLFGLDLSAAVNPDERTIRYSSNGEDSRDSPPGWSLDSNRLVFASTRDGDPRSRIFLQTGAGEGNVRELAQGEDPAWQPLPNGENWIAYSGRGREGSQLGLWRVSDNGQEFRPLTNVEGDRRPAWAPDGAALLFMSERRHNNWEIYELILATGEIKRLTEDPAQDGLPTVSPDGKYVAFVSDRSGHWQIWVRPLAEREGLALPVATIQGQLTNWLEHTIQWVN